MNNSVTSGIPRWNLSSIYESFESDCCSGSSLDSALLGAGRLLKKRTLVMVFSDFRTSNWFDSFGRLCHKHDVVAVRIEDSSDYVLPSIGSVPFKDVESSYTCVLPTSSAALKKKWAQSHASRMESWKYECVRHGGIPLVVSTQKDSLAELLAFFSKREIV